MKKYQAVLFDLDGTLVDTAADMELAINLMRGQYDLKPLSTGFLRTSVSQGAKAMLEVSFGEFEPSRFSQLRQEFLELYSQNLAKCSKPYPGIDDLLDTMDKDGVAWGIVTNKPGWLSEPLLKELGYWDRSKITISGDTLQHPKPHPMPMQAALGALEMASQDTLYLGDALVDVKAAAAVNMQCIVAGWGYLNEDPLLWEPMAIIQQPDELLQWL